MSTIMIGLNMYVPPIEMKESARVWVYSSNRFLMDEEIPLILSDLKDFVQKWTAHNQNLKATVTIRFNRHIILAVDEEVAQASGCSIDASVKFIQELGAKYNFDGLDRLQYTYIEDQKPKLLSHHDMVQAIEEQRVHKNTLIVNPLVKTWGEYNSNFIIPVRDSFLMRFVDFSKAEL